MTLLSSLRRPLLLLLLLSALGSVARAQEQTTTDPAANTPEVSPAAAAGPDSSVEEILVSGTSVVSAIDQSRFSESIMDVLNADDFAATGDSNVVDALSRVTGVTTVGDKYVYVRGLGERYSQTLFNNASLPSPDPFRRVVPLDLFPSGVMEQLSVQKTYAPYLPGDFAGGSVQLTTKAVPAEREGHMTLKLKANTQTTFQERPWYNGGSSSDWTGFDGGYRDLPGIAARQPYGTQNDETQKAGLAMHRRFADTDETIPPGFGTDLSYANHWETYAGDFGFVMGGEADNVWQFQRETRLKYGSYTPNPTTGKPIVGDYKVDSRTQNIIHYSGLGSASWKPSDSQTLRATLFYTHLTDNEYDKEDPIGVECGDYYQDPSQCLYFQSLFSEWREQALTTAQLVGTHNFKQAHDLGLDWGVSFSNATQDIPDARYYGYRYDSIPEGQAPTFLTDDSNSRRWESLNDDAWDVYGTLTLPMKWTDSLNSTVKVGTKYFDKKRDKTFDQFRFLVRGSHDYTSLPINEIFADPNINPGFWYLSHEAFPYNSYTAEEEIIAGFLQADTEIGSSLRWMVGARYESYSQPTTLSSGDHTVLNDDRFFPATELTWLIRDDLQLRGAFSQTVNRPDMLERVDRAKFQNPENRYIYTGDSRLQVAELNNYDLRLEWYHGSSDSVELAAFYKDIKKPIEEIVFPFGLRSWRNAKDATLYGVEVSMQQNLAPLGRWGDDFTVRGNGAWIKSDATPGSTDLQFTNNSHPLQGQSEWIANLQVTHEYLPWDTQTTLAWNWSGERLSAVGADPTPDSYEQPTQSLDLTFKWGFDLMDQSWDFTFKARNLIDGTFEETQQGLPIRSYTSGRDFTIQIGKDF